MVPKHRHRYLHLANNVENDHEILSFILNDDKIMQIFIPSDGEIISILINDDGEKISVNFSCSAPNFFFSEILKIFHEELIDLMI